MEILENLPVAAGFSDDHKKITNELVSKTASLLCQEYKIMSQGSSEDWSGNFEERIRIQVGEKYQLEIVLRTLK